MVEYSWDFRSYLEFVGVPLQAPRLFKPFYPMSFAAIGETMAFVPIFPATGWAFECHQQALHFERREIDGWGDRMDCRGANMII